MPTNDSDGLYLGLDLRDPLGSQLRVMLELARAENNPAFAEPSGASRAERPETQEERLARLVEAQAEAEAKAVEARLTEEERKAIFRERRRAHCRAISRLPRPSRRKAQKPWQAAGYRLKDDWLDSLDDTTAKRVALVQNETDRPKRGRPPRPKEDAHDDL